MLLETRYLDTKDNISYIADDTVKDKPGLVQKAATIGAVAAFSIGAYKTGALKNVIKKTTDMISDNYTGKAMSVFRGTKKWLMSNEDSTANSVIRASSISELKERMISKNSVASKLATQKDIKKLTRHISKEMDLAKAQTSAKKSLETSRSSLIYSMKESLRTLSEVENIKGTAKRKYKKDFKESIEAVFEDSTINKDLRAKMVDEVINLYKVSDGEASKQVKRTGYRKLRVGDVFEQSGDDAIRIKKDWQDKLESMGLKEDTDETKKFIENFFLNPKTGGKKFEEVKRLKFDNDLLIDEKGAIKDLRKATQDARWVVTSLANDFAFPFVKMNPLKIFNIEKYIKPKTNFAVLSGKQAGINGSLEEVSKASPYMFMNGKVFDSTTGDMLADDVELFNQMSGLAQTHLRRLWGISLKEFEDFDTTDGSLKRFRSFVGKNLNVGYQDTPNHGISIFDPTTWPGAVTKKLEDKMPFNRVKKEIEPGLIFDATKYEYQSNHFVGIRKGVGIRDVFSKKKDASEFLGQFMAGRRNVDEQRINKHFGEKLRNSDSSVIRKIGDYVESDNLEQANTYTLGAFKIANSLNEALATAGLGFSTESTGSVHSIFREMMLKRYAPVVVGVAAWNYLNYESENILGFQPEDKIADAYVGIDVGLAKIRDVIGITEGSKRLDKLMPGFDQITDIPMLGGLDWSESAEERADYWANGEDAIRKGRYWNLGNTPFSGGKIEYFRPNWVRRVKSDWQFTETKWGSREEYFQNHWLPTPSHPLAPIKHFLTDRYHYDEKHYDSRPYMQTGTIGREIPFIGPLFASTVGQILKPSRKMHMEYWGDDSVDGQGFIDTQSTQGYVPEVKAKEETQGVIVPKAKGGKMLTFSSSDGSDLAVLPKGSKMSVSSNTQENEAVVNTASGNIKVYRSDSPFDIRELNMAIKQKSMEKAHRGVQYARPNDVLGQSSEEQLVTSPNIEEIKSAYGAKRTTEKMFSDLTNVAGIRGFALREMTGTPYDDTPTIATSDEMLSFKDGFWDANVGGTGGNIGEIFRRFIPKDAYDDEKYNPIKNQMPLWMPGEDYFTDFKKGDPYTKVPFGEIRLPGHAYEAINGIDSDKIDRMEIGASSLGYDEEKLRTKILQEDSVVEEYFVNLMERGTKWHEKWEKEMHEKGIAISTEGWVENEEIGIGGFYDMYGHHDKIIDWLFENSVEFKYYAPSSEEAPSPEAQLDPEYEGFYYEGQNIDLSSEEQKQAFKDFATSQSDVALVDPKTRGKKAYDEKELYYENLQQVNFYGSEMNTPINYLIHMDRENDGEFKVFAFATNPELLEHSVNKVERVRQGLRGEMESGALNRGDFYSYLDRFRVLADVAPYSDEYREYKSLMSRVPMREEEKAEYDKIVEQVSEKKDVLRLNPYKFKTANIHKTKVTVTKVLDNNTFYTKEYGDNPIKMAGIRVPSGKDDEVAEQARQLLGGVIREGKKVTIGINADPMNVVNNDTYKSIGAVVYDGSKNINRMLLEKELAKEKENDYSATGVHARFTQNEISFGSAYETFAHRDTVAHTKFLQVRSGLESYKRRHLYGQDFQTWSNPVRDYLEPAFENAISKDPIIAIGAGALIGAAFGRARYPHELVDKGVAKTMAHIGEEVAQDVVEKAGKKAGQEWKYGRIVGAAIGATIASIGVVKKELHEEVTNEEWIPKRRQKEREINEYIDMLKYVKHKMMFEDYAKMSLKKENFDIREYIKNEEEGGDYRKSRKNALETAKTLLKESGEKALKEVINRYEPKYVTKDMNLDEAMKQINRELREYTEYRDVDMLPVLATEALKHYNESKKTMYGYEAGDPLSNVLQSLPKTERMYMESFMNAPEEERMEILSLVPSYMRRPLESAWGLEVEKKKSLEQYFKEKQLPGRNWVGWNPGVDLDTVKVKIVQNQGLNKSNYNIWDDDIERAKSQNIPIPDMSINERADTVRTRLMGLLGKAGVQDVEVNVSPSSKDNMSMNLKFDQRLKYEKAIKEKERELLL